MACMLIFKSTSVGSPITVAEKTGNWLLNLIPTKEGNVLACKEKGRRFVGSLAVGRVLWVLWGFRGVYKTLQTLENEISS